MLRTFIEHHYRSCRSLDGLWGFELDPEAKATTPPAAFSRTMPVPSVWEQQPGLESYRGGAWYRTPISGRAGHAIRLVFGGVSHTATVFIDDKSIGEHQDAFGSWDALVPGLDESGHDLCLHVDNTFGDHSALHIENDYYTYGGITRPVELQYVPEVFIRRLKATPARSGERWLLDVEVELYNWSQVSYERQLTIEVAGRSVQLDSVDVSPGETRNLSCRIESIHAEAWSADHPKLYNIQAQLADRQGTVVDDLIDRVGFREIAVSGEKLLLNGKPVRLRGYNRHEDHPQFGCALPLEAICHDLQRLLDLGSNFVRTSHYPNDLRFLDLCDELGLYVWEESHARNTPFDHPRFDEQMTRSTQEMIDWHHNHPCILMWGCLNECESRTPAGRAVHQSVIELIRRLDPSRPVTFASNKGFDDICLDLVDIVSWNLYPGWYQGEPHDVETDLEPRLEWLATEASGGTGKPLIISEFGAGGIYGYRHPHRAKWTEEYQTDLLEHALRCYLNHPRIVGAAVWQYCDIRVTRARWENRPRTMNNKGVVDEFRRPKLCYPMVKQLMHQAAERF